MFRRAVTPVFLCNFSMYRIARAAGNEQIELDRLFFQNGKTSLDNAFDPGYSKKQTGGAEMENDYFAEFLDLTKTLNYMETAENMNISTSALSKHIMKLEQEVGVSFFDRTTRTVKLNRYGRLFAEYAAKALELEQTYLEKIHAASERDESSLLIGYMPIMDHYGIPDMITEFMTLFDTIPVTIIEANSVEAMLKAGCNFLVTEHIPASLPKADVLKLGEDQMSAILPNDHPLAGQQTITAAQLRDETFILHGRSRDELYRSGIIFQQFMRNAGFEPKIEMCSSHVTTIIKLVRKGLGVSVLYHHSGPEQFVHSVSYVDLEPAVMFNIYLVRPAAVPMTKNERIFYQFAQERIKLTP